MIGNLSPVWEIYADSNVMKMLYTFFKKLYFIFHG